MPASTTHRWCQNCLDLEYCFTNASNACRSWNETRCPNSVIQPDYADPGRFLGTQLQDTVIDLGKYAHIAVFKCPVVSQYYEANAEEDSSFLVFQSEEITALIRPRSVLYSRQAGGVLHKVNYTLKFDAYTFVYASLASLLDLIKYADFRDQTVTFTNETYTEK